MIVLEHYLGARPQYKKMHSIGDQVCMNTCDYVWGEEMMT